MNDDDWGSDMIRRYPKLFGTGVARNHRAYPRVGGGWRSLVELTIRRISDAVCSEPKAQLRITSIEQKYGSLRILYSGSRLSAAALDAIDNALTIVEAVSEHTCELCGDPGRLYDEAGTIAARCSAHAKGRPVIEVVKAGDE
jgi:hypothetical protein